MGGMLDSWQQLERWADRHTIGIRGKAKLISARADSVQQAIRLSEGLAVYWILRDFRELDLQGVVNDIVEVLRQCLVVMLTATGGGALLGGIAGGIGGVGAGAVPGVVVGAGAGAQVGEWILIAMGLKALAEYVVNDMPGIARDYWAGIHQAWQAATAPPLPQQPIRIDQLALHHAAEKIARAHVAVFVLLLMGIVAYLAKGRGSMRELAESVRGSKVGPRFAEWMVRNEGKLKARERFQPLKTKTQAKAGNEYGQEVPTTRPRRIPTETTAQKISGTEKIPSRGERIAAARLRQQQMLVDNVGYNVSPTSWDQYPTIGRNGTFVSDRKALTDILGDMDGRSDITLTRVQAMKMEGELGLEPGSLQDGFKIRRVTGLMDMTPLSPLEGNAYFLGPGNHLPGGGPELVVRSIPTTDTATIKTILNVKVRP
ncbi:MAG: DUF6861 domain-containing protein [Rhodanobacter sp.]|uniref:DUF6861 domain-containing protein n=1 Tax=Rhodanobacter sp. KK11 TaxID=3083255 RepID=UPI0029676691|nr:hypothetical protein [Rhodanobacter sp. KK11]MDW2982548.1 hypothetical protein [Rhodanobacter sp. KK11]